MVDVIAMAGKEASIIAAKFECQFRLADESGQVREFLSPLVDGTFHIFVHEYDTKTYFWWGVAEIALTPTEFLSAIQACRPQDFAVDILVDGRPLGSASHRQSELSAGRTWQVCRVALVGTTMLDADVLQAAYSRR